MEAGLGLRSAQSRSKVYWLLAQTTCELCGTPARFVLPSKLTVGEMRVQAGAPLSDELQYAEKRQGLLDMLDAAPAMLDPVQQRLPETLETALEQAIQAWDDDLSDTAGEHSAQATDLAAEMGYLEELMPLAVPAGLSQGSQSFQFGGAFFASADRPTERF